MRGLSQVSEVWQQAFGWIERQLGGKIVRAERQPRWRPAWFLDLERAGERVPLYFRGDRGEAGSGAYSLEHEMRVLQLLEANEIPVPHVYGFCDSPRGILMERSRGRANLATAGSDEERQSVLSDYMAILARIHQIDLPALDALALPVPETPTEVGLADFSVWERAYRKRKVRPEPEIEFLIRWVHRNVPTDRARACLVCSDSGQFLFDEGRVTALLDLELATLGDPLADLAGMLSRDLSEPMGDLSGAFRIYEKLSLEPLDWDCLGFHVVRFCAITPLAVAHLVAAPPAALDWVQYLAWYCVWLRAPLEWIGSGLGVEQRFVEEPEPTPGWHAPAHDHLASILAPRDGDDAFAGYERDAAYRVAEYLRRAERLGPALESVDLDEAAPLLGSRPASRAEADVALEALVAHAEPELDAELVRYFQRRVQRLEVILGPSMRELQGASIQLLKPNATGE